MTHVLELAGAVYVLVPMIILLYTLNLNGLPRFLEESKTFPLSSVPV